MPTRMAEDLRARLAPEDGYERVLDASRRWAREQWFRAGVHVLRAIADEREAGAAFTRIAETCVAGLYPHVVAEFARKHGDPPGDGHGGAGDGQARLVRDDGALGPGPDHGLRCRRRGGVGRAAPAGASAYYPRLTQALVAALTAPTAEGALYEVDMRLRPSGRQGPVAVSLSSFDSYQTGRRPGSGSTWR